MMPHVPLFTSEEFKGKSERGLYGDVVQEIDWSVGQILNTLKKEGLDKNTLVVFTSDNGPWVVLDSHGGSVGPLFGAKATSYEGGMRVPAIFYWPGMGLKSGEIVEDQAAITLNAYGSERWDEFVVTGSETPKGIPAWVWGLVIAFIGFALFYFIMYSTPEFYKSFF